MTPGARIAAAIGTLDAVSGGASAEQALTNWARGARYAGSGDRAAVRDHVFDVLRQWRSCAARGGGQDGRALLIGYLRGQGIDPDCLFTGEGHAPAVLSDAERAAGGCPSPAEARDLPDWLWPRFEAALGPQADRTAALLRHRAPVMLRVNGRKMTRAEAQAALENEGIRASALEDVSSALQVIDGERKLRMSAAYRSGAVEIQDASCQAAMERIELPAGARVLDYCAGGGGKTLALAARLDGAWFAHDAAPERMADLPARAERAGVKVELCASSDLEGLAPFDAVLCDVPCSGSGTWRRAPQAKWALTPERLEDLAGIQQGILARAATLLAPGGLLIYCTCSVLNDENEDVVTRFLGENNEFESILTHRWPVCDLGDGFFSAHLLHV